jgi:chromosome partitioning protein
MGVVVAFVSQKGGVGKSTLAREAAAGGLSVKVADLDVQQGTLVNWQAGGLQQGGSPLLRVPADVGLRPAHSKEFCVLDRR